MLHLLYLCITNNRCRVNLTPLLIIIGGMEIGVDIDPFTLLLAPLIRD